MLNPLDAEDHMRRFRDQYIIPSKATLKQQSWRNQAHLDTWSSIAVHGHFRDLEDSLLTQWQLLAEHASKQSAPIVGAKASEVAIMGSLTMNLHLLMASFYTPTPEKKKIIMEWKAFPVITMPLNHQIRGHGYKPDEAMPMQQSKGLVVGWDLAHAAGNVPLQLHDWNVDFAVWCTYKYMNAGPGSMQGAYVHERHGEVDYSEGEDKAKV
ncbi:hypothetical protein DID88_005368 [Monilinia fructigena]|uniref:Aminotransferase class V domain-containing protein n=1 Tax=Monilinia fructigena TaxID=38457 RepID=A0A395IZN0_9HELO|nr:hypothetical protein DID88_005368 [Monilinia fructigena]